MQKDTHIYRQTALIILDGWGWREETLHNAIAEANTPFFDHLWATYPHALFEASGEAVGLPAGQMGNSEIGHLSIGAGVPIDTDLVRIHKTIESGAFFENEAFRTLCGYVNSNSGTLHVTGLLSDGGVHSHEAHMYAFLRLAREMGVRNIAVHPFLDGRDTPPQSAVQYLQKLEAFLADSSCGRIASVCGRFYAMDRDQNWERVDAAVEAIVSGTAEMTSQQTPCAFVTALHEKGIYDEHIPPTVFTDEQGISAMVRDGDGVVCINFRADRARMFTKRIAERVSNRHVPIVTFTEYDSTLPVTVAFSAFRPVTTLANEVSRAGRTQAHIAETEKYAHATYFLNGGREAPHEGEEHVLVESRRDVRTHDEAPEMRAKEIADEAVARIEAGVDFLFVNFANADMVGHTAHVPALHTALEAVDRELKRIVTALVERGGVALVTADHGNAEQNFDSLTNTKHTAHTTNPVPVIVTDTSYTLQDGSLPDIAPTVLTLMGLPVPPSMTGVSRV